METIKKTSRRRSSKKKQPVNNKITFGIIVFLLAFITLPKAGMLDWIPLFLSTLCAAALVSYLHIEEKSTNLSTTDKAWLSLWIAYSALVIIQLLIIPRLVSWNSIESGIEGLNLSNYPVNTPSIIESWTLFCCYWSFAYLISKLNRESLKWCFITIVGVALFQILYGTISQASGQQTIIGIWPKLHYVKSATGSFVNHNHYANYIAVVSPLVLAFLLSQLFISDRHFNPFYRYLSTAIYIAIAVAALVASTSRMGAAVGAVGIACISYVYVIKAFGVARWVKAALIISLLLAGLMLLNFIGVDQIAQRYQRVFVYDLRWEIWSAMFDLPLSMWFWGAGAGCFFDVFFLVHPPTSPKTAYYAHNDYLQFILEYGIIGSLFLFYFIATWYRKVTKKHSAKSFIKIACLISISMMALHATMDFSLHIPANALLFWFSVGCLVNKNS